jgi:hypothetical protein
MANYTQPDFRIPVSLGSVISVQSELSLIAGPTRPAVYIQPMNTKEDPSGNIQNGKSGKGSAG